MVQKHRLNLTGAVLAGGKGKRLGVPKAFIKINGERLLDSILSLFTELFETTLLISGEYELNVSPPNVKVVNDLYPSFGPIGGLITAIKNSTTQWLFMTGCDYPMLKTELIRYVSEKALNHPQYDLVIPHVNGYYQVLHAAYNRRLEKVVEQRIGQRRYSIKSMIKFAPIKTLVISEEEIREVDPELVSFVNLNTQDEVEKYNLKVTV